MQARGVFDRHDVFALASGIAEFRYRRRSVREQAGAKGRVDPGPRHHAGAVSRPDLDLVGFDQEIERGRIDIAFFGQNGFQRTHPQFGLGQFRMVVVVVMVVIVVMFGHGGEDTQDY